MAVALQLVPGEPAAGPWRPELLSTVITALTRRGPDPAACGRPVVLAVDGRSNSGKTTLAARIGEAIPGSAVVHTDDIAWAHSRFGWADLRICQHMLTTVKRQHMLTVMESALAITEAASGSDPDTGLRAVAALRALTERLEILQVDNARRLGWSWQQIAERLGVTKQTVHRKHGKRTGRQP